MQNVNWKSRMTRVAVIPAVFGLGAVAACSLRGNAGQQAQAAPPVQPPAQVIEIQSAFEKVAEKLRPSVVFIKSRRTTDVGARVRQGQNGGQDGFPFPFPGLPEGGRQFRGFPNVPGGQDFRMMPRRAVASGSGVIVSSDGWILTNDHVVQGADKVTVKLQDGRELTGQVKRDFRSDLALVKIDATGLPSAELADSERVKIGQWAIAFGSPFGLNDTMTVGIVSSLHRRQEIGGGTDGRLYPNLIQTDASINPGNSGGPLVDIYGRIIGINVAIESPSGGNVGIGFAIPANTAKFVMEQLRTKGVVTRGYLGLAPTSLNYSQQKQYGVTQGALVASVVDGTPAAKAGFQVEDVVVRYNGKPVTDEASLRDMVARTMPGETVDIVVRRNGAERTLKTTLGTMPEIEAARAEKPETPAAQAKLGLRFGDASDPEVRKQLNLKGAPTGAVVVEVIPGSPAMYAGIQAGDIVLRLNGKTIPNPDALSETVRDLKSSGTVPVVIRRGNQNVLAEIELE